MQKPTLFRRIKSIFSLEKRRNLLFVFEKMGFIEKIIFFIFAFLLAASALLLLKKASDGLSVEVPVLGGTLNEGVVGYPRYVNPLLPVTDSGRDLTTLVFGGLMKLDGENGLVTDLAKDYKVSDDGLTYTVTLKDNIFFQDDVPVTAYDVEFTIKKATDPIIKSPKAANWEGVVVHVIDEKTIEFTLKKPYAPFIENLTLGILPMHIWKDIDSDAFLFSQFNFEPVGSGPYKIKDIKRNASGLPEYYHLAPFEKYAGGEAYIQDVYIYFYTSEDKLIEAYQNGTIDSMNSISPDNIKSVDTGRSEILKSPLPRIYGVFFNQNEAKVFADSDVRKALGLATPEDKIIKDVLLGFGTPIEGPIPKNISILEPRTITDNDGVEQAQALLAKAGWIKDANGILGKKNKTDNLSLTFSISTSNVPELKAIANLLKTSWEKIGASVEVKVFDSGDLQQKVIVPRRYDALLFGESIGRNADLYAFWHSSERNHPGLNIANYTNSKADKILQDIRTTSDTDKRITLYQNFEKEIYKDNPAVFLYSPDLVYVVPSDLKGISLQNIAGSSERFATINKWYKETEKVWNIPWFN
ncbi:MAG: family 5 extracellular solute-binding protein peptide/nickel transport system substrate-binding [Candidatus Taylorbacteria bacterium]|nr:family 5 extracellular solute-binding protein peptide/nickel transport system substrate-binding [Candidatus Taylorbacteria bacterium]